MTHIFISYSHKDKDYASLLAHSLEESGFPIWIDGRLDYGSQWPRVIQESLDRCEAFVLIMTPNSYASNWVQNELSRAQNAGKPIFPLLLGGPGPWLSVQATQYIDVRNGELPPARFYEKLAVHVRPIEGAISAQLNRAIDFTQSDNTGLYAFVLIKIRKRYSIRDAISTIEKVVEVGMVVSTTGDYDIIALIRAEDVTSLGQIIGNSIENIPAVESLRTLISADNLTMLNWLTGLFSDLK